MLCKNILSIFFVHNRAVHVHLHTVLRRRIWPDSVPLEGAQKVHQDGKHGSWALACPFSMATRGLCQKMVAGTPRSLPHVRGEVSPMQAMVHSLEETRCDDLLYCTAVLYTVQLSVQAIENSKIVTNSIRWRWRFCVPQFSSMDTT